MPVQYQSDPVYNAKPMPNNATTLQNNNSLPSQQTPGGLNGQIDGQRYGSSAGAVGTNYANFERGVHTVGNGGIPTGASANATQWNTNIAPVGTGIEDFQGYTDSAYAAAMRQMQPQMEQQQRQIEQQLVSQGLKPGSSAYNAEMDRMTRGQNDMLQSAAYGAQGAGLQAQNQYFNQESQNNAFQLGQAQQNYGQQFGYDQLANQRGIAQIGANASRASSASAAAAARYGADQQNYRANLQHELGMNSLNEQGRQFDIDDIYRTNGQQQNFMLGALGMYDQYQNTAMNQFNTQNAANNQWYQQAGQMANNAPGVNFTPNMNYTGNQINANQYLGNANQNSFNNGASLLSGGMAMFSDARLKENVVKVGSVKGINIYDFDYIDKTMGDGRYRGVMAQEVMNDYPDAVKETSRGYMVDYRQLPVDMEVIA